MKKFIFLGLIIALISCTKMVFNPYCIITGDPVSIKTKSVNYLKGREEFVINDIWQDSVFITNAHVDTVFWVDVSDNKTTVVIRVNQDSATLKTYNR